MGTGDGDTCLALWKKVSEAHRGDGEGDDIGDPEVNAPEDGLPSCMNHT